MQDLYHQHHVNWGLLVIPIEWYAPKPEAPTLGFGFSHFGLWVRSAGLQVTRL